MIPDFFPTPEPASHFGLWKSIIGLFIVLFATFVGVEIRLGNEDEEPQKIKSIKYIIKPLQVISLDNYLEYY